MKKTTNIHIGGLSFHIEETAYTKLEEYLQSIRNHFEANEDKEEMLNDIESRIAERFSENKAIITEEDIDTLIETMGTVEQFDTTERHSEETTSTAHTKKEERKEPKKLYRDIDDVKIAGVCSGLGHYFGVDPLIFRILFLASIFAGGSGIIAYIILWALVPEALTASQKLAMRGDAVTLSAMADVIKEKIDSVKTKKHKNFFRKLLSIPVEIMRIVVNLIQQLMLPAIRIIMGAILIVGSFVTAIGITIALGILFFADASMFTINPPLQIPHDPMTYFFGIVTYLSILIPLIFFTLFGSSLISRKKLFSKTVTLSLLSIWLLAVLCASVTSPHIVMKIKNEITKSAQEIREQNIGGIPFSHTGNIVKNNPGNIPETWYLIYEERGAPGLQTALEFDETSKCLNGTALMNCSNTFEQGASVHINGIQKDGFVFVQTLTYTKK